MGRESVVMQNARDHSKRICTTAHIADLNVSSVYSANKKPVSIPCAEFAFYTNHENWNGERGMGRAILLRVRVQHWEQSTSEQTEVPTSATSVTD